MQKRIFTQIMCYDEKINRDSIIYHTVFNEDTILWEKSVSYLCLPRCTKVILCGLFITLFNPKPVQSILSPNYSYLVHQISFFLHRIDEMLVGSWWIQERKVLYLISVPFSHLHVCTYAIYPISHIKMHVLLSTFIS